MYSYDSSDIVRDLNGIKQENTIKCFEQIPLHTLVEQIKYKGQLAEIRICLEDESYTSGVSAYNQEPVTSTHYDKRRRIKKCSPHIGKTMEG